MSAPVVGLFSECPAETVSAVVLVLAGDLMEQGKRVVLVDADPGAPPFQHLARIYAAQAAAGGASEAAQELGGGSAAASAPERASLLSLLRKPERVPAQIDISAEVGTEAALARGARLWLVPALGDGEVADPALRAAPPIEGSRRAQMLRATLSQLHADVVLLVGTTTHSPLNTVLLGHACHVAVLLADSTAREVLRLAFTARQADAARGGLIPTLCVETRDGGEPVPEGAWTQLWNTHPSYLPPERRGHAGPEQLFVLEDKPGISTQLAGAVWALAQRGVVEAPVPSEAPFAALYQEDRAQALAFFRAQIAPRLGTRASAVESLRAVWDVEPREWADVQQLAKFVVQKFRWAQPTSEALELVPIYEALLGVVNAGGLPGVEARVRIDLAGMLCHAANALRVRGEDLGDRLARAEALVLEALGFERTPTDSGRAAEVLGLHSRLAGSARHYSVALKELSALRDQISRLRHFHVVIDVVVAFAQSDPSLWHRVRALCAELSPMNERYALYYGALAELYLGDRAESLKMLNRLGIIDFDTYQWVFQDPDFRPLGDGWAGAASPPLHPR